MRGHHYWKKENINPQYRSKKTFSGPESRYVFNTMNDHPLYYIPTERIIPLSKWLITLVDT